MLLEISLQDKVLKDVLLQVKQVAKQPEGLLESVGESLLRVNNERHDQGLDPDGNPWEPLKESSKRDKRKGGPLNKSGQMLRSLNYQVDNNQLMIGFDGDRNAELAFWHHHGTDPYTIKPKNGKALKIGDQFFAKVSHPGLPARPLLDIPESDQLLIGEVASDYLTAVLNNN